MKPFYCAWPASRFLAAAFSLLSLGSQAHAGYWEKPTYVWSGKSHLKSLHYNRAPIEGDFYSIGIKTEDVEEREGVLAPGLSASVGHPNGAGVSWSNRGDWPTGKNVANFSKTAAKGATSLGNASVHAVLKWHRNAFDPTDNPPKFLYVSERVSLSGGKTTFAYGGALSAYNITPWPADFVEVTADVASKDLRVSLGNANWQYVARGQDTGTSYSYSAQPSSTKIRRYNVSGDTVVLPSVNFSGSATLSPGYERPQDSAQGSVGVSFDYSATPVTFALNVSGFNVLAKKPSSSTTQVFDGATRLQWVDPTTDPNLWDKTKTLFGFGPDETLPPLPYHAGHADFSVIANIGDATAFSPQIYKWNPENLTGDNGQNPETTASRSYTWNFGEIKSSDTGGFPQTTSVQVAVTGSTAGSSVLSAGAKINWYPAWASTDTGLQNTVTSDPDALVLMADGSHKRIADLQPGDSVMCLVEGDPGTLNVDQSRTVKVRPMLANSGNPAQPGERQEAHTVISVTPTDNGSAILIFDSTPHIDPEFDPNAPGFDEIQQTRVIDAAYQETAATSQFLVKSALEAYVFAAEQVSTGRLQGWGIEHGIKGIVALGRLTEKGIKAGRAAQAWEQGALKMRGAVTSLRNARARVSGARLVQFDRKIAEYERRAAQFEAGAADARSYEQRANAFVKVAREEIRRNGCFVAGTRVWMGDGTTKPIEQVKEGNFVLSKKELTGEVASKKVLHTSVKPAIWTRKITFSDGSVLETTDEHPLYVEGKGFLPAKEAGIGTSIVTRAGPSARITAVQADVRQATVYNFTVDTFHTYFVGDDALWVHNADPCDALENKLSSFYPAEISYAQSRGIVPITLAEKEQISLLSNPLFNPGGEFKWVVKADGEMRLVPSYGDKVKHTIATGSGTERVLAAGKVTFSEQGGRMKVLTINNDSGHYIPDAKRTILGLDKLQEAGFDISGVTVTEIKP